MTTRIFYTKPSIGEREIAYAKDAVESGWGARCYDYIISFEEAFRARIGTRFAHSTSSCTGALHLGLAALGIGAGDEVILADTNWVATVAPIVHLGATPVFVDILQDSWCIDPRAAEAAVTSRTRAIVATHLYGNLADIDALSALCERRSIALIEDAAEALGSASRGRMAGSFGRFGVFSFHGSKTMTTGEGGMLVTDDAALHRKVAQLNNHGRAAGEGRQFWASEIGYKYRLSNVQAAIGLAQLERLDELVARKRDIFQAYQRRLGGRAGINLNPEPAGARNGYWMPTAVFAAETGIRREILLDAFGRADIDARVFFWPLSSLPMFRAQPQNRNAYDIPGRAINLPSYHEMGAGDIDRVADVVEALMP